LLVTLFSGFALPADPDYFPLQPGYSWVYKLTQGIGSDIAVIDVGPTQNFNGADYAGVNFFGRNVWLRAKDDGTLMEYDASTKQEKAWIPFGSKVGDSFPTQMDPCTSTGKIESKSASYKGPIGEFTNALRVTYQTQCADAGITSDTFLPYVGLVQHATTTIAGPRVYDLMYSRTGATEVTANQVSFSLALDAPVYPVSPTARRELTARMTVRSTAPDPITLTFPSGQDFDLVFRNEKGEEVYRWSAGRGFTQIFRTLKLGPGEKNFAAIVPLDNLAPGKYIAEANLATDNPKQYVASVPFEFRAIK
jgi:hypothetical protein